MNLSSRFATRAEVNGGTDEWQEGQKYSKLQTPSLPEATKSRSQSETSRFQLDFEDCRLEFLLTHLIRLPGELHPPLARPMADPLCYFQSEMPYPLIARNAYAPLWCKSNYSFLEGASDPDELVNEAHRLGLRAIGITDRDGVYGMVRAHMKAQELGIQLLVGSEVTLFDESTLTLLATSREGYANLCRLISKGRLRSEKGSSHVNWDEVSEHATDLIALWGGKRSLLGARSCDDSRIGQLRDAFGDRLYAMLARHQESGDPAREKLIRDRAREHRIPTVAGSEILYHTSARRELQDVMTCIRHGVALSNAGRLIHPNAEHALRSPQSFAMLFEDDPASVERTLEIADRCKFSLSQITYRYPSERLPSGMTSAEWVRKLTYEGAQFRYPGTLPEKVRSQIEKELQLINELEYDGYFLTMWEIVQFCRAQDILCQGRGSAANSAVCYFLGITAVDPIRLGLLFERFISRERAEPPDIDLDIEHDRREEVIQHVYTKYGRQHAAMVANFIRYRTRSAVRDVGKALGFTETAIERLVRHLSHHESPSEEQFDEAGFDPHNQQHQHLLRLSAEIQDMPRHLSIHPGGFLLGHEAVHDLVPIENATMPDRTVIQWDKNDVEDLGLFKVDLLGLGALNVVHRSFDLIEKHLNEKWTLATIPDGDEPTYQMIRAADTVGTFQIESRAQMSMLPRLKPANYYDLVIEISIVRPGPISGGMVHPYLRRRNNEEPVTYPHDSLKPVLEKTLGIPLFQEQVMQLAVVAADYTPGEADQLRRDMAAWRRSGRIERHRERLISRMADKGIKAEFAEQVFEQIKGFGEYGFPESHAASFALIAYATSWLKRHYPASFLAALLNAQPMGFYSAATLVEDGKHHEIEVRAVDVCESSWECTLEAMSDSGEGFAVRMGFKFVHGLRETAAAKILSERVRKQFTSLADFKTRVALDDGPLTRLAESGALECFKASRRDTLWDVFGTERRDETAEFELEIPEPAAGFDSLNPLETISWDYQSTGHSPRGHPLAPLRDELTRRRLPDAATIGQMKDGAPLNYAGMVICRQRPGTAGGVVFMTLEDETGFVNLVVWQKVFEQYQIIAKTEPFLGVTGKLQVQDGVTHLIAQRLWVPQLHKQPQNLRSRDFR
jgi:error-prone DNA polymerase